jgi:ABC-type lipoprotein release transport system permease subunit
MTLPLSYNFHNLLVRKTSSVLTLAVVALVVAVLAVLMSFASGMYESLASTGSDRNIVVLKPGATAESTSLLTSAEYAKLMQTPGLAFAPGGAKLISNELSVQTSLPRLTGDRNPANIAVRGVDDAAFLVHEGIRLVEGRRPQPGAYEVIVGAAATRRYANLRIGDRITLGRAANRDFEVVGVFEAGGTSIESEIWAPRTSLSDAYQRYLISSTVMRLEDPALAAKALDYITGPTVQLNAKTQRAYYADLARKTLDIVILASTLVAFMGLGAAFAVANTMYSSVDRRRREIAVLRTLGFSRRAIVIAFLIESVLLCLVACAIGLAMSVVVRLVWPEADFLSDTTWTVLAYEPRLTPNILVAGVLVACGVGVAGAAFPALRASRIQVIEALRKA